MREQCEETRGIDGDFYTRETVDSSLAIAQVPGTRAPEATWNVVVVVLGRSGDEKHTHWESLEKPISTYGRKKTKKNLITMGISLWVFKRAAHSYT